MPPPVPPRANRSFREPSDHRAAGTTVDASFHRTAARTALKQLTRILAQRLDSSNEKEEADE